MSDLLSITYPNALHFQLTTLDELYDLYVTIIEQTESSVLIEVWCPQTTLFDIRTSLSIQNKTYIVNNNVLNIIQEFVNIHLQQFGFYYDDDISIKQFNKTKDL